MHPEKKWRRRAAVGGIASHVLTIPVMTAALLFAYFSLSSTTPDVPTVMADVSPQWTATPDKASPPPALPRGHSLWPEPAIADTAGADHESLDPSGAGRMAP